MEKQIIEIWEADHEVLKALRKIKGHHAQIIHEALKAYCESQSYDYLSKRLIEIDKELQESAQVA